MEKKLAIVTRSMFAGGAERVIAQLANYFVDQNIQCTLIMIDDEKVLYDLDARIKLVVIGKKNDNKLIDKYRRYNALRKTIKDISPDIVLSMPEDIGIYVILALLGLGIPIYVSERNNPWVMPDVKITRVLRKLMYPFVDGLIFQTEMAKSFFSPLIQKKGVIIGNPVDASRIPAPFIGKRKKVIVGAGRLDKQKNFALLISAFAEFSKLEKEYELVIYGEGQLRNELEVLAEKLGIAEKVHLPGRQNNLLELMNDAAMFVLSSDYEGMPNVLVEAMCMGMPVIATDCPSGGPKELIEDDVNGVLVPVGDQTAIVNAMKKLLDSEFAKKISNNAFGIKKKLAKEEIFSEWKNFLFK